MQNTDYQMQGKEDIEKIQSEFLERILKVCKLEKKDISMQLLEILRYDCISLESISDKFNEILDEKQLNLIVSIADEYHLKYSTQTQRQKIEPEILQAISLNQTVQDDCIPSNICVQNNQIIENKYQEIQKEVFDEQSQNIKPNFETTKELDLNQPIIYQALDIENSKKNEAEFQDVLENIDSKTQQTSWIKVQKESMLNSKEKKEQIALLQLENTQMKEETITEIVTDIEIINNKNSIENNIQQQTDQKQYLIDDFVKNINEISQVDLIKDHYPTLNKLLCYLKETANLNIQFNESNILSFIENLELSGVKERKIISQAKSFITQYKDLLEEDMKILNKDYNMVQEEEHKKQFRNTFDLLDENKKQICEKQIKVMVESLTEQNIKLENKQIFRCQTIIAKYPEFENYVFTLQEIQKIENMQPINILDIYNKWLELDNCVNQGEKQIILQLQQFNFQRNSNLIEFEIIQKLLKALQNKSNKEIEDIFDILQISYKKMKEILQIWNEFEDEQNKDNQQPEFLNFKQFIQGQINDKKLSSKVNNSKIQRIIDLLKSTNKQDLNELDEIFGQFDLTQKQIRLIQQQYEIYYQKTINQQNQVIQEQIQNERIYKKDQSLSKIYTLLYQQKDYCLDIVSLKVICEFQNIQELINQLKQNEVKTIGLYGDFKLAIKIIQSYYPNSPQLIDLDQYIPPNYDQLVAITDGYLIFLILQDQKSAFEGDIFDNEENQLYIRFLLDSCSILITCLNQMQVSLWSDINPFEQFEAFIPPKEYKDRSSIFLNQIKINSNLKEKEKNYNDIEQVYSVPGVDISIFINQYSRQWIIFANDTKKSSIGKINSNYHFEEGRLDRNIYYQQTQYGNTIERVDSCIFLNEKNNAVIVYEKKKKQFYEFFLSGQLKEIKFDLSREISNDGVIKIQNIPHEESGDIQQIKNTCEGDFYFIQTEKYIFLTNPNYIVKHQISLKENFKNFKLIITENASLLVTLYANNQYECYLIQGIEDLDDSDNNSNLSEVKAKIGNIVIDKIIKSMVHYGSNYNLIGSPELVHQLFFYENSLDNQIQNFGKCIEKYFDVCMMQKNIQFKITHNQKNCFNNIDLLINKLDSMIQNADSITCQDLQFIMQTRIPIQLTTIQQANYLPLKDGLFKQDLMNIPEVEDQIEQIKKQISFGWIESLIQSQNQEMYTVAMCGRQSVGKSSQLNRMFGTRFGVSASRCTDGIWMGLSKVDDKLILVMDCEGLFSIRRTDDEEVKLLQQITSISDITIVFCDIDGINQPLLSLFKKLQICSGKMQSDSFFLGTMVLLTKNVQDKGDQKKLQQESSSHLSKKETKNTISKIFRKGLSYGFLKSYLDKDYDLNLQNVRDELLYKQILLKNKARNPQFLLNTLKYSMIQIYLNDDQDIDLISKQSEIKECYDKFLSLFYDISQQNFISNERLILQFEYKPISDDEKLLMKEEIFEYQVNDDEDNDNNRVINNLDEQDFLIKSEQIKLQFEENIQGYEYHLNKQTVNIDQEKEEIYNDQDERDILEQQQEINFDQEHQAQYNYKSYNILQIKQQEVKLIPQQAHNAFSEKKSQNNMLLENIFQNCFRILSRINFNNFIDQMQSFFDSFIGQRTNTIQEYFNNRMPKEPKYRDIVQKFQQKLNTVIHSFEKQFIICRKKCNKCNRSCINISGHKGDCNCETSHKCYTKCQKCNNNNECFLISGHQGIHYCKEVNHLCKEPCQISNSCKELCTLIPHLDNIKHSCQREHKCEHQCRLYNKCGKSCSLQSGHEEINHLCDSTQCYDKCKFCDKLCGFNLHDHDVLLSNIEKNKEILMKEGKLVTQHLCGDYHNCLEKCEKPGVCSITYKTEEKTWETATSKFEYQFIKPCKSQKQCNVKIKPWQTNHKGDHQCESAKNHRCDQQCPECLSYCFENYNHSGNHNSKNHRNKEKCIFVSETDQIKINYELGNIRKYLPGESSTPENCLQSCLRMGRAHIHLRVCKGGDECAEKKYPFARHSTKQYKPYTDLIYDEMLCKGYWNSINWEPPVEDENLQIIQSCNVGCSHESHTFSPNYCTKQAWHEGLHQIDPIKCEHLGSGIVDICFTIDTTGSMAWAMSSVKEAVNSIVKKFEGKSDIMYCIVSYRDHPPQDQSYIFKINSQLTNKDTILQVLSNMKAEGGGDAPEAVMDGLYNSITSINWRDNSQRFIFHICDSPPHGKKFGASSSDKSWTEKGCPCGINEDQIAYQLKTKKVFYYLVKVNSSLNMMENIFKNIFGSFYKQTIDLNDTSKLNIEIVQALIKEINLTNEFYHIKD